MPVPVMKHWEAVQRDTSDLWKITDGDVSASIPRLRRDATRLGRALILEVSVDTKRRISRVMIISVSGVRLSIARR